MEEKSLSHLDSNALPTMVDVAEKQATTRQATAQATVFLGPEIVALVKDNEIVSKKGAVFQTAIIAGTMGAKKTPDLIPMCHPIGLESIKFAIEVVGDEAIILCTCRLTAKTGVEMEALTGATIAALTLYDMCKAMSHTIEIRSIKLLEKIGGKSYFKA
jgi:cyclic pyranopterin monophosphate synthase